MAFGALDRYVHRVGRTARMGKVGEAVLFLMPSERAYLGNLESRGVQLRPLNVLPALDLLPPDTTQQVIASLPKAPGGFGVWHVVLNSCTRENALACRLTMPLSAGGATATKH